jgi:RNA polymerase sigma-70 factor, ECF subfamily
MQLMCIDAMDAVEFFDSDHGALAHAGWKPGNVGHLHRVERMDQPSDRLVMHRIREQRLGALMARLARGDQAALAELYDETHIPVYSLALRILHHQPAAEDVTIEVYTQVHRQASHYDPQRGTPSAWLLTLTRSRAIDRLRIETLRREREESLDETTTVASLIGDPEASSASSELQRIVQHALSRLTPEQREAIEIAYYSGLSHREIAAKLGQPLGTVKTRIRTGMLLLREYLAPLLAEAQLPDLNGTPTTC